MDPSMTDVLIKRGNVDTETDTHRGKQCENTQREESYPQTKERDLEQILPSQPSGGTNPANTLILGSGLQNCVAISLCCLSRPVYGTLLQQLQQTNTGGKKHFEERQSRVRGQRVTGDRSNREGLESEAMLISRTPNRPSCSLHQYHPPEGFVGGQNSPKGSQEYFYTRAYT